MKTPSKRSLKKKLTIIILLSSTIPLALLGVFSVYFIKTSSSENISNRLMEILRTADDLIDEAIANQILDVESLGRVIISSIPQSEVNHLNNDLSNKIRQLMFQYMRGDEAIQNLYFVMPEGEYVGTYDLPELYDLPNYLNWGIYRTAQNHSRALFYPNMNRNSNKFQTSYSIVYKLETSETLYGYLILDVSTEFVQNILTAVKGTSFGYVQFILTSSSDTIIYNDSGFHSPISYLQNVFRYDRLDIDQSEDIKLQLSQMTMVNKINEDYSLKLYGLVPNSMLQDQVTFLSIWISVMVFVTGIFAVIIGYLSTQKVSQPLIELVDKMRNYRSLDNKTNDRSSRDEVSELEYQFDEMIERIEQYHQNDTKKQEMLRLAEIKSLMSQINPHFLNNTLDSIKWKAKINGVEDIAEMVTELNVLLKASMNTKHTVSVEDELAFVESYIHIQQFRYDNKIKYISNIQDDILHYQIPKLIIQPIIENSIIHGLEPLEQGGIIEINAWEDDDNLYFSIVDNGMGSDYEMPLNDESAEKIGLINVHNRLKLHFGDAYGLSWHSRIGQGTIVFFMVPKEGREGD